MQNQYLRGVYWQLTGAIMLVMVVALGVMSYFSHQGFERNLVPEMEKKALTVGASIDSLIDKATSYGIPFKSLYGVEQAFAEAKSENLDFSYMAGTDENGLILWELGRRPRGIVEHSASAQVLRVLTPGVPQPASTLLDGSYIVSMPLANDGRVFGLLHIGISQKFIQDIMLEVLLDVVVVLVVALFFTLELLNFLAGASLAAGLREFAGAIGRVKNGDFTGLARVRPQDEIGRILTLVDTSLERLNASYASLEAQVKAATAQGTAMAAERLQAVSGAWAQVQAKFRFGAGETAQPDESGAMTRIRAPLFTFILAEELSRTFLPSYVSQLMVPVPGISPQVVIGLPIVLFMLIVAIGQPFLGAWSERVGRRRAMLVGAMVGTAGFAATALAYNLLDLLLWRSVCAIGYALVFVAAQGYVLDHARPHERAQGFALFVGAIMVATICGPPMGGILADNIGSRLTFGISALLCALSIVAIQFLPETQAAAARRPERLPTLADFGRLLFNSRFMTLTGLAAMPAKVILTGFCFYLVPLYIVAIGSTQAMAGRMLMVYAVMMVLIVPVAARYADRIARREGLVAVGLCVSGVGGLLLLSSGSFLAILTVVILLGFGQALSIASQSALVGDMCSEEIARYGDGAVYGVYRMLERFGNALGPLVAGLLVVRYGYEGAFVVISTLVLSCGILFSMLILLMRPPQHASAAPAP